MNNEETLDWLSTLIWDMSGTLIFEKVEEQPDGTCKIVYLVDGGPERISLTVEESKEKAKEIYLAHKRLMRDLS